MDEHAPHTITRGEPVIDAGRVPRLAYSLAESEQATGLSASSLKRLIAEGKLASTMVGHRRLIPAAALERLVTEGVL